LSALAAGGVFSSSPPQAVENGSNNGGVTLRGDGV
jgi:hypothetical protein